MKKILPGLLLLLSLFARSQDITGIWRGSFLGQQNKLMQMMGEEDRYKFEIQLAQNQKSFEGVTYSYKTTIFYGKASCKGTVNTVNNKVFLEELKLLELKVLNGNSACVMTCKLQYSKNGNEEFMEGTYESYNSTDSTNCGKGTVFLRKVTTSDFYKEPFVVENEKKKAKTPAIAKATKPATTAPKQPPTRVGTATKPSQKPVVKSTTKPSNKTIEKTKEADASARIVPKAEQADIAPPEIVKKAMVIPKVLANRENELVKTILVPEGTVTLNIYDNGSVDNDTVSVYLNNKLILSKKRLTEKPLVLKFNVDDENDEQQIAMVAENLGEIPPNTSLMVVNAGDKKYEVRITSTEQKNAVVVFRLKK
ncbi:MAG: hypothetical protein ABW174_12280 [Flavitalea sp.]